MCVGVAWRIELATMTRTPTWRAPRCIQHALRRVADNTTRISISPTTGVAQVLYAQVCGGVTGVTAQRQGLPGVRHLDGSSGEELGERSHLSAAKKEVQSVVRPTSVLWVLCALTAPRRPTRTHAQAQAQAQTQRQRERTHTPRHIRSLTHANKQTNKQTCARARTHASKRTHPRARTLMILHKHA